MDLSLIYEIQAPDTADASVQRAYHELIEQVQLADELGYRTAWLIEHHFLRNFSLSGAPEVVIGHLAAKTRQIRLGHGIVQLPFKINHPDRVAARIAVEDSNDMEQVVANGGAVIGSPETCARVLNQLADYGVDEALLIHQLFNAPHDKILRSLELLAKEVKPRLKVTAAIP